MGLAAGGSTVKQVINQVGSVAPEHFAHAQALLSQLPESLRLGVREQQSATATVLALALENENQAIRERQIIWLREVQPADLVEKILAFNSEVSQLDPKLRLPLLDLTIPALRQGSATDCKRLCKCIHGLVIVNRNLSLWYFVLQLVLWHRLQPCINPTASISVEFNSMEQIWTESIQVLSALARVGHSQADTAAYAFRCGLFRLPGAGRKEISDMLVEYNFADVKKSIERLRLASPKIKQAIVDACIHTVLVDHKVTPQEADLLRAIAMTLDCPIPPFLNPQRSISQKK
ncbi:hypothetical protein IQ259_21700 [Fortiea sp. LEGE XX443]|uniref:hypothetical protein n=1 Tax=Fortiea sp. LEGE XX443 TaxID=1828611 RepID=UPI001882E948|nr:hypothetical protein [Fortiea sp. LEGE XX443]MBE9007604.1 hypothetical protein [Fortiea sp. LEGE XX443]